MKLAVVTSGVAPPIRSSHITPPAVARNDATTNDRSLYGNGWSPSTSTRALVVADRAPDVPRRRADGAADDQEHDGDVPEREPVEVLGVENADQEVGQRLEVQADPLLTAGQTVGIRPHDHGARLRERERHHRERDPRDPQADRAEDER